MALEMIIEEKQKIDAAGKARRERAKVRWNDLDDPTQPQSSYLSVWSAYFRDFKNPDKQWCYGLKKGEEQALIDYIVAMRRALGLAEIDQ